MRHPIIALGGIAYFFNKIVPYKSFVSKRFLSVQMLPSTDLIAMLSRSKPTGPSNVAYYVANPTLT